jgi:SAM-dependent methyltransferase
MDSAPDFGRRAELEEQMDGPCSYEELRDCLRDLASLNRLLLAHRPILQWLTRMAASRPAVRPLRIVDVGSGYGDMLRRIERWAARHDVAVELTGVDINPNALRSAREATPAGSRIRWILGDVTTCAELGEVDLVTSCGVMHHLTEAEIVSLLRWAERNTRVGWFLCDLHRKPMPYRIFDVMTRFGRWHRFIRQDGLASIRRSFLAEDWERMCAAAGLDASVVTIAEYKPARLCVERTMPVAEEIPMPSALAA